MRTDGWKDRRMEWTDGQTDGQTDGGRQNYIPPTSSGDKKLVFDDTDTNILKKCVHLLLIV